MIIAGESRPRMLGEVVQIFGDDDPRRSDKTLLVAALLALGIPRATREFFHATCEFSRGETVWKTIWTLSQESRDKRFDTAKMIAAWDDGAWLVQNPAHPLAILRGALTFSHTFSYSPRFTLAELANIEKPETWIEAAIRNLIVLLRDMPEARKAARKIIRFGRNHAGFVPLCMPDKAQTRLLRYVETPAKREAIRRAA
jgi:hypothetical protein